MPVSECAGKIVLPFTVDVIRPEEREKLNRLGTEIAAREGVRFKGYSVVMVEPYSVNNAKPILYFY